MKTIKDLDENVKLYIIQYSVANQTEVEHYAAVNSRKAAEKFHKEHSDYPSVIFKPRIISIQEVRLNDYNVNLERKIK